MGNTDCCEQRLDDSNALPDDGASHTCSSATAATRYLRHRATLHPEALAQHESVGVTKAATFLGIGVSKGTEAYVAF